MQLRRIVVGVDFTDASLAAARWAASHFAPTAEVVLVHVAPGAGVPSFVRGELPPPPAIAAAIAPGLYGAMRGLAELVDRYRTRVELVIGNPADALAGIADEMGADVVCVGRGSRRRGSARFGATTPQRLLARTRLPTLIVPVRTPGTPGHVIVGVDERSGGQYIADVACRLAAAFEASVDALYVIDPEVEHLVNVAREASKPMDGVARSGSRGLLAQTGGGDGVRRDWLRDRARGWVDVLVGATGTSTQRAAPVIRWGDPGSEIIHHARRSAADLIVVGRGNDVAEPCAPGAARPLGSTARLVMWAAPCPVLVLPPDESHNVVPPPPDREGGRRAKATVIALRSIQNGAPGRLPPAAQHQLTDEEGAA